MLIYLLDDFNRARGLAIQGQYLESLVIYQNLYFDYPTCVPMLINYANCFALDGQYGSAINLYNQAIELDPGNPKILFDRAQVAEAIRKGNSVHNSKTNLLGGELR